MKKELFHKVRYTALDSDTRLHIKEYKKHWWSRWRIVKCKANGHPHVVTYIKDSTLGMVPSDKRYWHRIYGVK